MTTLRLENCTKRYGADTIFENLNITIEPGEFVVIVGPSGCGKSSLLRMVAGLETVSEGDILLDGKRINDLPPKDRNMAMVFQNYALYPHMNVYQNMAYTLKLRRFSKPQIHKKVLSVAKRLGLEAYLKHKPNQLSGGQRQRVAMGRAMVRDPSVFLFDEPLSNLDASLRVQLRREIKQLHQQLNVTSLYVTHDQIEAMTLADTLIVLSEGKIQQIGAPLELYQHPANRFVAQFIGSPKMNLLPAKVAEGQLQVAKQTLNCPAEVLKILPIDEFELGIRAQACAVCTPENGVLQVECIDIERTGAQNLLYLKIPNTKLILTCLQGIDLPLPSLNSALGLRFDWGKIHQF